MTSLVSQLNLNNLILQNKFYPSVTFKIDYFAINVTYIPDVVPPQISVISPLNQTYSTSSIDFNVSLNENASWCGFSLDDDVNVSMTINSSLTGANYLKTGLSVGSHNVVFSCNDTTGNMNSTSRVFSVDNISPQISIISPLNQTYNNATILVNISASDSSGISSIWFYNGTANLTYTSETYYIFSQGSNTIIAYANDSLGNLNSTSVAFYLDSLVPSLNIIKPEEGAVYGYNTSLPLNFSVSDLNLQSCKYNLDNSANITLTGCQNTIFNISEGSHTLHL